MTAGLVRSRSTMLTASLPHARSRRALAKKVIVLCFPDMRWLLSVGSFKWQVSFAEYRFFYRSLLQKRPTIQSIRLCEASPYPLNPKHATCLSLIGSYVQSIVWLHCLITLFDYITASLSASTLIQRPLNAMHETSFIGLFCKRDL